MRLVLLITTCLFVLSPSVGLAQVASGYLRHLGLETAWKGQMQLPSYGRGLVSTHLWVNPKAARQYAVVELPQRTLRIPADTLGRDGQPIGLEEAKKRAQEYASRLSKDGQAPAVQEITVPQIKLVLATSDGLVQVLDGETGKLLWSTPCGTSRMPAFPAAVSQAGVSILHGGKLYVLDWDSGKQIYTENLRNASSNAIGTCGNMAFVADIRGRIESYGLTSRIGQPYGYIMTGRVVGQPVSLANGLFTAMSSDAGYVYVFAGGDEPTEWIRYESSAKLSGSLSAGNNAFYSVNANGVVAKITVDDRLGRLGWEFHFGQATTAPPMVLGDTVYVASEAGEFLAIDDNTGFLRWRSGYANIQQPIGKVANQVFGISNSSELVALDNDTGAIIGKAPAGTLSKVVVNPYTDRIYLVGTSGEVQCIRPAGAVLPTLAKKVAAAPAASGAPQTQTPLTKPQENIFDPAGGGMEGNPFDVPAGGGGDPFGGEGGSDPFGGDGGSDPFGGSGGSDPFGGDNGSMPDPFGGSGGSDPFSGSNGSPF